MTTTKKPAAPTRGIPTTLYKILRDGCSIHGGSLEWSLPDGDRPGAWHEVEGPLVRCSNGFHLTNDPSGRWERSAECYLVEAEDFLPPQGYTEEFVARRVRLIRRLTWTELEAFGITPSGVDHTSKHQLKRGKKFPPIPKPPKKGPSPALRLVETVWNNRCGANEHSWRRVNNAMQEALSLAIAGGLSFDTGDFEAIANGMRGSFWMGDAEHFFSLAVKNGHTQACVSFETWVGRKPFIWEGKRLHVRAKFQWAGVPVSVTSFAADGASLVACSYKPIDAGVRYSRDRIDKRFTVTIEDLRRAERDRKVELSIMADATDVQKKLSACDLHVDVETIVAWSPEQRAEVRDWALVAEADAYKERVKPPPPPAFLQAIMDEIAGLEAERQTDAQIAQRKRDIDDARNMRAYHIKEVQHFEARIAALEAAPAGADVPDDDDDA